MGRKELNQTKKKSKKKITKLNQPFQIEFTVLPAKSDSESNLQDRIRTASSTCNVMFSLGLALYYILSSCKQHITSLSLLVGTTVANQ